MSTYLSTLYGALISMCVLAVQFFMRYWRLSSDRFFLWLAGAFGAFAVNWALLAYGTSDEEHTHYIFAVRLVGFLFIIAGIVGKNRARPGA